MDKQQKAAAVEEIGNELGSATAVFAIDYRGISVPQAAELRVKLSESDTSFNVVKNRLAKRVTADHGASALDEHLVGPTALAYVKGDAVLAAKAIADFTKANEVLEYKGGIMDGAVVTPEQFGAIARLPGVDVLRGQLVGLAASPLTGIVRGLNQLIAGLASQLGQVADQGLIDGKGSAPAEAEAAEAGDAEVKEAEEAEIAEAQGTEEAGTEAAAEASGSGDDEQDAPDSGDPKGPDEAAVDAEPPSEDSEEDEGDAPGPEDVPANEDGDAADSTSEEEGSGESSDDAEDQKED